MSTFVSVGNATQPFQRLLDAVASVAQLLPQPVIVQCGTGRFEVANCNTIKFLALDEFERLVALSQLLIIHAGAGSVINAIRSGKVPVVMPRRVALGEVVDNHQLEFALAMKEAGRVIMADNAEELVNAVYQATALQRVKTSQAIPCEMTRLVGVTLERYARVDS